MNDAQDRVSAKAPNPIYDYRSEDVTRECPSCHEAKEYFAFWNPWRGPCLACDRTHIEKAPPKRGR